MIAAALIEHQSSNAAFVRERPPEYRPEPPNVGSVHIADQRPVGPIFSEAMLSRLWAGQRFPGSALVTRRGEQMRVLHPGRKGRGPGPDFLDAIIATPAGVVLRGDVELHVRSSDFRAHGHWRDPRYDGVCLHVVFEDDTREDARLACGRLVPTVALAPWARRRAGELAVWLRTPRLWREPCRTAVERMGVDGVETTLETLGERRFREREAAIAENCAEKGPGEALYEALLEGLVFRGGRDLSRAVVERLPWSELVRRLQGVVEAERAEFAEALLLGVGRLLPSQQGLAPSCSHEEKLEMWWRDVGLPAGSLVGVASLAGVRPANHPARRLAGLARLIGRHGIGADGRTTFGNDSDVSPPRLVRSWCVEADEYWRRNIAPGLGTTRSPGALIGRRRAIELLVNAVLPWAAAVAEDGSAAERIRECFARLPRPARYGALSFLEDNLRSRHGSLRLDARRQQGLLALYKSECTQGGCGRCPLS